MPHILRENPLDFFESKGADHPHTRCDRRLEDINVIINENARGDVMVE